MNHHAGYPDGMRALPQDAAPRLSPGNRFNDGGRVHEEQADLAGACIQAIDKAVTTIEAMTFAAVDKDTATELGERLRADIHKALWSVKEDLAEVDEVTS